MSAITANRRELSDIKASEVMSPALLTANEQWTVVELAQFLVSDAI